MENKKESPCVTIPVYGWDCPYPCSYNEGGVCRLEWDEDPIENDNTEFSN